ncbi:MAG TPA: ABC transporter substrate-binding protein [Dehalococcoidia bacterium]|nr:ABC transporter substrate-binding protein [Dehalococcoidia bacterium]
MRLRLLIAGLLALLLAIAAACGGGGSSAGSPVPRTPAATPSPGAPPFPVTITDSQGKEVTLQAQPQHIVALAPSFAETLFAIGAGDAIVAVDENTNYPSEAAAKTKVSGFQPSVEGIAGLQPDLVLIFFDPGGVQDALQQLGIPVLFLATPATVEGVLEQIEILGKASGHASDAASLAGEMRKGIKALTDKLADVAQGPRVFHELDPSLFTTCPGEFTHDMYVLLKAQNIAAGVSGLCQMSNEAVIQADPEVIILADEPAGESAQTVAARPGWDQIAAVRSGRVEAVDPDIVSRPGPRLVEAMKVLARALYPERFP